MNRCLDPLEVALVVYAALGGPAVIAAPGKVLAEVVHDRVKPRIDRLLSKAEKKRPDEPLDVGDRVAAKVLMEAAFTDDDLTLEYLAGVMAASSPEDDAGTAIVAQIGRLSAAQLRFHYVVYRELRRLWPAGTPLNLYMGQAASKAAIRLPLDDLMMAIDLPGVAHLVSTIPVLIREGLLADKWEVGAEPGNPPMITARVTPTGLGAELLLWGQGLREQAQMLFDPALQLEPLDIPGVATASLETQPPPN